MNRKYGKLRIESLEDRTCPAPFALPGSVATGGGKWRISNNAPSHVAPFGNKAFAIANASLSSAGLPGAYNGAFELAVNGTVFQDPTGTVDLTGNTITSNTEVLAGLSTTVQYYFDDETATVRAIFSFSNPSSSTISTTVDWENDTGNGTNTAIIATANGDNVLDPTDSYFTTDAGVHPVLNWVRFGPGTVQRPSSTPQVPGNDGEFNNPLFTDEYSLTVPAGQTKSLMFFGQMADNASDASEDVTTFDTISNVFDAGLLNGLTQQQEAQIVNWQFPAITSADATTFHETLPGNFTVTTTSPDGSGSLAISETGALPMGVHFTDNGDGTASLAGTPAAGTSGSYPITIVAIDGDGPSYTQDFTLTVNAADAATHFSISAPDTVTAGAPFSFTVTALDATDNPDPNYTGTVHFDTTDPGSGAVVPVDYTFTSSEDGTHTFTGGATLVTAGSQALDATDTADSSITGTADVNVNAAAATQFIVAAPASATAGTAFDYTVTAEDQFGNTDTSFSGPVHMTSSDLDATLPSDTILTDGTDSFNATLRTAGTQTITASSGPSPEIMGVSGPIEVNAAPATQFLISAPLISAAGSAFTIDVTAEDQFSNIDTNYNGTVDFSSSDTSAALPPDSTLTDGEGSFTVTLFTAGDESITARDIVNNNLTGSTVVQVDPANASQLSVTAPANATAGAGFNFTVTALDPYGNIDANYEGPVRFTSSDGSATLPPNSTLNSGMGTFSATLDTAGNQTITVSDAANPSIGGTSNAIAVSAAAATHFSVIAPPNAVAGSPFNFTVTAEDQFGNTDTGFDGSVHMSSTDLEATLPADTILTNGSDTFSATLVTAGTQTISADSSSTSIAGVSGPIAVSAAAATHFVVLAPANSNAGTAFNFSVTAEDAFDNTATSYSGVVHFKSTDGIATLPANSTLAAGTGTFSATLKTAGNQTITAADTLTPSITGTSGAIDVSAGMATHYGVSAPANVTAGVPFNLIVTPEDQFNNPTTSFSGNSHFTSTDLNATLPGDTFVPGFMATFSATLRSAGMQSITVTYTGVPSITGTSNPIDVSAAAANHFGVDAPTNAVAGMPFNFAVTARDQFNNIATSYSGTIAFTSSDNSATLPAESTLTAGSGTFTATLDTAGNQTITATDTVSPSITGNDDQIDVAAGMTTHFHLGAPANTTAGVAFSFTVTAEDTFNNTATTYAGTVHFTSSDGSATLPANSTLSGGTGEFSATLDQSGNQTLTATDSANSAITGTCPITVIAAAATHFSLVAPSQAVPGTAFTFSVTALDAFANVATSFAGTVHFSASTASATLPADSTLANGTGSFSATFFQVGTETISAQASANAGINGTSNAIAVSILERLYAIGSGPGLSPSVIVYDSATNAVKYTLTPFEPTFTGGVHVALADVNADGIEDIIVGAGPGGGPQVQVFSGKTGLQLPGSIGSFFAYSSSFRGGVNVAAGDINGDGFADIVTGAGDEGGPQVRVFSGKTGAQLQTFFAYESGFRGGVNVAVGDVNGDGTPDIIAGAGNGGAPRIRVFAGGTTNVIMDYFALDPQFRNGVNVAAGDINGDGFADIVAGAGGSFGGPQLKVTSGKDGSQLFYFFAYTPPYIGVGKNFAVNVAVGDVNGDGTPDIITGAGERGSPLVKYFSGKDASLLNEFYPFDSSFRGGVFVGGDGGIAAGG